MVPSVLIGQVWVKAACLYSKGQSSSWFYLFFVLCCFYCQKYGKLALSLLILTSTTTWSWVPTLESQVTPRLRQLQSLLLCSTFLSPPFPALRMSFSCSITNGLEGPWRKIWLDKKQIWIPTLLLRRSAFFSFECLFFQAYLFYSW